MLYSGDCIQYELLQVPQVASTTALSQEELPNEGLSCSPDLVQDEDKGILHAASFTPSLLPEKIKTDLSGPNTKSMYYLANKQDSEEQFLMSLILPLYAKTCNGRIEFNDLFLPPPPPPKLTSLLHDIEPSSSAVVLPSSPTCVSPRSPSPVKKVTTDHAVKKKMSSPDINAKNQLKIRKSIKSNRMLDKDNLLHSKRDKFCPSGQFNYSIYNVTSLLYRILRATSHRSY